MDPIFRLSGPKTIAIKTPASVSNAPMKSAGVTCSPIRIVEKKATAMGDRKKTKDEVNADVFCKPY